MASVLLLAAFLLCSSFPVGAQDTRTYCPGSCLREYVDKGYCAYTYVVPPGSRFGGCTPPVQLAETKEETGCMKNLDKTSFAGQEPFVRLSKLPLRGVEPEGFVRPSYSM
ncbi:Fibrinogen- domains (FReDs) [Branchiostoma belcheri]|nr:Fibrinogen- domains (FReDs) [Branchiostoma belcheri]